MNEIETVKEHCKHEDCIYRRNLEAWTPYCDYIGVEKRARGCDISNCDKYKPGKKIRPRMHERYELDWDWEVYEFQSLYCEIKEGFE